MIRGFTMSNKFAKDLKKSLKEVVAHKKGELELYSEYIEVPELAGEDKPKEIKKISEKNRFKQKKEQ